jgi:hypothetical protein
MPAHDIIVNQSLEDCKAFFPSTMKQTDRPHQTYYNQAGVHPHRR